MRKKRPIMKPIKLSDVEVLKLYGEAGSGGALALKAGKPGQLGQYHITPRKGARAPRVR
jgi:hypothetical protein